MIASIELEIQLWLLDDPHPNLIADQLVKKMFAGKLTQKEVQSASHFLYECGFYPSIINYCAKILTGKKKKPIPWHLIGECLTHALEVVPEDLGKAFVLAAREEEELDQLSLSSFFDKFDPEVKERREKATLAHQQNYWAQKRELLEQLNVFRSQRLFSEEERFLEKALRLFPKDPDFTNYKREYRERWAKNVVIKKASRSDSTHLAKYERDPKEIEALKPIILKSCLKEAKNDPDIAYDLAVMLHSLDAPKEGIKVLEKAPEGENKDWLHLELLLAARYYAETLQYLLDLEKKYPHSSDITFATSFARAEALWGLNQKESAIEVLQSIVNVNPQYRTAHSLLMRWKGLTP